MAFDPIPRQDGRVLVIEKGSILCYRIFDIAEEIRLDIAASALSASTRRLKLARAGGEYVQLPNPPVAFDFRRVECVVRSYSLVLDVGLRLFDHGAVAVVMQYDINDAATLESLVPLADAIFDSPELDALARQVVEEIRPQISASLDEPHLWEQFESYTIIFVERAADNPSANQWLQSKMLPRLLLGESTTVELSAQETADVIQEHFSYTTHDLTVIDWNAAVIYEPSGSRDVIDVLEIANAQLLELRYYDDYLDKELTRVYDAIGESPSNQSLFFSPYKKLLRELTRTLIDLTEFIERVENALKIVGDVYLARIYEASVRQLRIRAWQATVTRKQRLLAETYELLKAEVDTGRQLTLEFMVVVLIVVEIVFALTRVVGH